ncbi:MAG TPA: phosphopentomutase [Candidatus Avidehalobacter gallistercoris]|mgnify:CR=1 FL=1|uniref:Phosphopentomutase n=1 Tax=Candidatus Avidehalobacter gallistercoris TaxID=2840694 RepID=A0A9D1HJH2_9FIRM|nr:phosphopentomutase [Candidatus Avidehalobacter gallistercoris]
MSVDNKRVIMIVLDSVGAGEAPDAAAYGDLGSNTLGHIADETPGFALPNLARLGLGNILPLKGVPPTDNPLAAFGRLREVSCGKDTTAGHWELAGTPVTRPLPTYPNGFPPELIAEFERRIGRKTLGNVAASGTLIIQELGGQHLRTGYPIVYTSADSVFQIAAHEEVIPLTRLYEMCHIARGLLVDKHGVGRVIARPFVGEPGYFQRTANRRDFSLLPPEGNVFMRLRQAGVVTVAIGKIHDIFAGQNIDFSYHTAGNTDGMDKLLAALDKHPAGFIWANLVDFDMLYGHRNNVAGYAAALQEFDAFLPQLLVKIRPGDLLIITADHGNDPTTPSTDHSREYVPLLAYGLAAGVDLQIRSTFADVGATVTDYLGAAKTLAGASMLPLLVKEEA